ncbi:CRTAC1 family protein [bacterium]|nr:CRTAC1 family protein [bacterium]
MDIFRTIRRAAFLLLPVLAALLVLPACAPDAPGGGMLHAVEDSGLPDEGDTYGATVLDWNGDELPDLLVSRHADRAVLYLNRGGLRFAAEPLPSGLPDRQPDHHGSAGCDFDRDGDWDAFVGVGSDSGYGEGVNQIWVRTPAGWRLDARAGHDLPGDPVGRGRGAVWADLGGGPEPELLVFNYQSPPRLLSPTDQGWVDLGGWLPWAPPVPQDRPGGRIPGPRERARSPWIHNGATADLDGDGRCDLLALGRPGWAGLLLNTGRGFAEATERSGLGPAVWPLVPHHAAAGDLDGDGDPDLVLCGPAAGLQGAAAEGPPVLWINESVPGRPRFRPLPVPSAAGARAWASALADLDNDGVNDLLLVQHPEADGDRPLLILQGAAGAAFSDVTALWGSPGEPGAAAESVIAADFDLDGDLDLLLLAGGDYRTPVSRPAGLILAENRTSGRGLTLELAATASPPHGLGAVVTLEGDPPQVVRQQATVHNVSSSILPVHFGIGDRAGPFRVRVEWPAGSATVHEIPHAGAAFRLHEDRPEPEPIAGRSP